jgi:hypothetical protein
MNRWKYLFWALLLIVVCLGATQFQKVASVPSAYEGFYQVQASSTIATAITTARNGMVSVDIVNPTTYLVCISTYPILQANLGANTNYWVLYPSSTVSGNTYSEANEPYAGVLYAISSGVATTPQTIQVRQRWR